MTAEAWAVAEVGTILDRKRDQGEMASFAELREETGVGHDDLKDVLDTLRESGQMVEAAPGEFRRPFDDEVAGGAAESRPAPEPDEEPLAEEAPRLGAERPRPRVTSPEGECLLTMGVAKALGAEALGKLVAAGIEEAAEQGGAFVLRVSP